MLAAEEGSGKRQRQNYSEEAEGPEGPKPQIKDRRGLNTGLRGHPRDGRGPAAVLRSLEQPACQFKGAPVRRSGTRGDMKAALKRRSQRQT